jgi:hypothetical protein
VLLSMPVDKPTFKETLWEWRGFSNKLDSHVRHNILSLPRKHGKPTEMLDRYLCVAKCDINIKIRQADLRIKKLNNKSFMGIEEWTTEAYSFPISPAIFKTIIKYLKLDLQKRQIENAEKLMSTLLQENISSSVRVITVRKQRELHAWPPKAKDGVTVELAEIKTPERVTSIAIEHHSMEKVIQALKYLQLPSPSMKVLNYVDCLKVWYASRNVF